MLFKELFDGGARLTYTFPMSRQIALEKVAEATANLQRAAEHIETAARALPVGGELWRIVHETLDRIRSADRAAWSLHGSLENSALLESAQNNARGRWLSG